MFCRNRLCNACHGLCICQLVPRARGLILTNRFFGGYTPRCLQLDGFGVSVNVVIDFSGSSAVDETKRELNRFDLHDRVIAFTFMTAQATLLESAAGIMTRDMKNKWFQALLRQDMAFYDIKDVSGTASIISSNGQVFKK